MGFGGLCFTARFLLIRLTPLSCERRFARSVRPWRGNSRGSTDSSSSLLLRSRFTRFWLLRSLCWGLSLPGLIGCGRGRMCRLLLIGIAALGRDDAFSSLTEFIESGCVPSYFAVGFLLVDEITIHLNGLEFGIEYEIMVNFLAFAWLNFGLALPKTHFV